MPARVMKEFQAPRGLPRKTASVCPECIKVIPAVVREKEGRVIMEKTCRVHGYFWDIISNDVDDYLRNVQPPQVPHGACADGPDEPLQSQVPGLLCERERGRLRLRADPRAD